MFLQIYSFSLCIKIYHSIRKELQKLKNSGKIEETNYADTIIITRGLQLQGNYRIIHSDSFYLHSLSLSFFLLQTLLSSFCFIPVRTLNLRQLTHRVMSPRSLSTVAFPHPFRWNRLHGHLCRYPMALMP